MELQKVIVPAAGLGTRFLPYTKCIPKEMIAILSKPAIHYIAQEAHDSSIRNLILVTSKGKESLTDYFDHDPGLSYFLQQRNKSPLLKELNELIATMHVTNVRQAEPLGLGHAICMARHAVGSDYFGVMLPDDIIMGKTPALLQLMHVAKQERATVIAVQEVSEEHISLYGVVKIKKQHSDNLFEVDSLVEKPRKESAPSNLAIIGRYVLSPKIFTCLDEVGYNQDHGEIQLTDGLTHLSKHNEKVYAYKIQGDRFDVGNPAGWLKAVVMIAAQDPTYKTQLISYLSQLQQ